MMTGRETPLDSGERIVLITGGAGFIGSNLAARLLAGTRAKIRILDNLSRGQVALNVRWLQSQPGASERLSIQVGDVRNASDVRQAVEGCTEIYHLAAQVAVTTSVLAPTEDFGINAGGTLNILEAARSQNQHPFLLFTSTNKVYGSLEGLKVRVTGSRYVADQPGFRGITEDAPLDFHSPYGCSKGAADQYVRDYARIYGLPTVVLRMSCICGPRQFGTEDQGWVAHFLYSILREDAVTVYGDGRQVRDILHVDDLLDAMEAVRRKRSVTQGQIFNVGGGLERARSVNEIIASIEQLLHLECIRRSGDTRPGDQPLYISDTAKLEAMTGWSARRTIGQILEDIHNFGAQQTAITAQQRQTYEAALDARVVA